MYLLGSPLPPAPAPVPTPSPRPRHPPPPLPPLPHTPPMPQPPAPAPSPHASHLSNSLLRSTASPVLANTPHGLCSSSSPMLPNCMRTRHDKAVR